MGKIEIDHTGSGGGITLSSDGTSLLLGGSAVGGGGGADLYAANESSPTAQPSATGANAIAIGDSAISTGTNSFAGPKSRAQNSNTVALGINSNSSSYGALGNYSVAIGYQAKAANSWAMSIGRDAISTQNESFAIGKSLAGGDTSLSAQITNNTSSYGASGANSIAIGYQAKTTIDGINSVAIGNNAVAQGSLSVAIGRISSSGIGQENLAMMGGTINSSKSHCVAIGNYSMVDKTYGVAIGRSSRSNSIGKFAYQGNAYSGIGHLQMGLINISAATTDATPKVLSAYNGQNLNIAQMNIPDNSCYTFTGTVSGREKASEGTDVGGWEVKGVIRREGSASTTTLVNSVINDISVPTGWAVAVSADTTNGALSVTVTGVASTNIKWIATIYTSEVTYA